MKEHKWFRWVLAAIMTGASFTACTNETEEVFAQENQIKLSSVIIPASRVTSLEYQSTQIVSGQKVGITITNTQSDHKNIAWTVGEDGTLTNTEAPVYYENDAITITAYHPHNSAWTGMSHEFSVNTDQSNEANYRNSDLLWTTATSSKTENAVPLKFTHKLAKIKVSLTSEESDLSNATIYVCGTNISASFNPTTGILSTSSNGVTDIKAGITKKDAYTASAIIIPQTLFKDTKLIKIQHDGKEFSYILPEDKEFISGKSYSYILNIKSNGIEVQATGSDFTGGWN